MNHTEDGCHDDSFGYALLPPVVKNSDFFSWPLCKNTIALLNQMQIGTFQSFICPKYDEVHFCNHRIWSVMFLWRMTTVRSGSSLFMTLTTVGRLQKRCVFVCVLVVVPLSVITINIS